MNHLFLILKRTADLQNSSLLSFQASINIIYKIHHIDRNICSNIWKDFKCLLFCVNIYFLNLLRICKLLCLARVNDNLQYTFQCSLSFLHLLQKDVSTEHFHNNQWSKINQYSLSLLNLLIIFQLSFIDCHILILNNYNSQKI